jgi:DNA invertase Pin-like site-specific DNA recombinase
MSTERQDYSIANQLAAIESYALLHDYEIVCTYADPGKSGIGLAQRPGLQKLLKDVESGKADFQAILVYDITRWGRFQDIDESAYYEFLCKRAGVHVHYCAEPFAGDDATVMASLLKAIKRVMAGEYLRELSIKVFAGQCRIARSGYKLGGKAGYGLRRLLVSQDGTPRQLLGDGERKSLDSDRVVYVHGPDHEVEVVKQIYAWFLDAGHPANVIAGMLNERGISRQPNGPWDKYAVNQILNHAKYAGCVVFNRTSRRLGAKITPNPADQWIVTPNSFEPIIAPDRFREVRRRRKPIYERSDAELIADLQEVLRIHGKVTVKTMRATKSMPSPNMYWQRFGSLAKVYEAAGLPPLHGYFAGVFLRAQTRKLKMRMAVDFATLLRASGKKVRTIHGGLCITGFGSLGIETAQWEPRKNTWEVRTGRRKRCKRIIVGRISPEHDSIIDFVYLGVVPLTKYNFCLTKKMLAEEPRGTKQEISATVLSHCH